MSRAARKAKHAREMYAVELTLRRERALVAQANRERDEAKAVLADLLAERGESWLAQLMPERAELLNWFRCGAAGRLQCDCELEDDGHADVHRPRCGLGRIMRIVGGPEETQRQVDAAHAEAVASRSHDFGTGIESSVAIHDHAMRRQQTTALRKLSTVVPGRSPAGAPLCRLCGRNLTPGAPHAC